MTKRYGLTDRQLLSMLLQMLKLNAGECHRRDLKEAAQLYLSLAAETEDRMLELGAQPQVEFAPIAGEVEQAKRRRGLNTEWQCWFLENQHDDEVLSDLSSGRFPVFTAHWLFAVTHAISRFSRHQQYAALLRRMAPSLRPN